MTVNSGSGDGIDHQGLLAPAKGQSLLGIAGKHVGHGPHANPGARPRMGQAKRKPNQRPSPQVR